MRIGIVSDIHCNADGLRSALEAMGEVDEVWAAGDIVFQFQWNNDVVEILRDIGAKLVQGNHDETILSSDGVRALAMPGVRDDLVEWLREQPFNRKEEVDGKTVLMTHGSPFDNWRDYHYPHEKKVWNRADSLECDVLIVGHTHFQMAERFGTTLVINPGSCGDPRDSRNEFMLSCAVWDTTGEDDVTFYNYPDPRRGQIPK